MAQHLLPAASIVREYLPTSLLKVEETYGVVQDAWNLNLCSGREYRSTCITTTLTR